MDVIELDELNGETVLTPTAGERLVLLRAAERLKIEWLAEGSVRLRPAGYVGSLRLSADRMIQVTTKVPIDNVLHLASLAYRTMPIPPTFGSAQLAASSPLDWLVTLLVFELEALLQRDMRQGYIDVRDDLPYVRGRILFADQVRTFGNPGLVQCEFSDFLPDTPENRIIRATLEALAIAPIHPVLRLRALELTSLLTGVTPVQLTSALFHRVRLTRLTAQYGPGLELCRLWFDREGVKHAAGEVITPAFFFPMEKVFEAAVANYLKAHLPQVRAQMGRSLTAVSGAPQRPFSFAPDVVIGEPPRLVLDTKYAPVEITNRYGGLSFENKHAYQVVFYAQELGCPGVLVYPRDETDVDVTFENNGLQFTFLTVDLLQPGGVGLSALVPKLSELMMAREVV